MTKYDFHKTCYEKIYKNNSNDIYKDSRIASIKNFRERLAEFINFDYIKDSYDEFIILFKLYYEEDSYFSNRKLDKNITDITLTFKEIFDEITKEKVKKDKLTIDALSCLIEIIQPFIINSEILDVEMTKLRIKLAEYNEVIDEASKLVYQNYNTDTQFIPKSFYRDRSHSIYLLQLYKKNYFNDFIFKGYFSSKELSYSLFNRIIILFFSKHYQRKVESSIRIVTSPEAYVSDIMPRYNIPKKDFLTLNDIALIYANSSSNSTNSTEKKIYDRLRKIILEIAISDLHKTKDNGYQIPYNRVINYLAELEIRGINNKKINQKTITKKILKI